MATSSVRSLAATCLGRTAPLSLLRDVFGVFGSNPTPTGRSLKRQLDLMRHKRFVKLAIVTIQGASPSLQEDLDDTNELYQRECDAWVYCVGAITAANANLQIITQDDCLREDHSVSADEAALFALGRTLGADVVGYYILSDTGGNGGCAAHPPGRRGFWVMDPFTVTMPMSGSARWTFAHELTHVIGGNAHPRDDPDIADTDTDNIMWPSPGAITNLPPDLRTVQITRITSDADLEVTCS